MIKDTNALCAGNSWQHYKIPFTTLPLLPTCCNASNFMVKVYPTWSLQKHAWAIWGWLFQMAQCKQVG